MKVRSHHIWQKSFDVLITVQHQVIEQLRSIVHQPRTLQSPCMIPPEVAMPPPASVHLQSSQMMTSTSSLQMARPKIFLTPAQAILQEQLRMKHADLSRRIVQQQDELKKITEQVEIETLSRSLFTNIFNGSSPSSFSFIFRSFQTNTTTFLVGVEVRD